MSVCTFVHVFVRSCVLLDVRARVSVCVLTVRLSVRGVCVDSWVLMFCLAVWVCARARVCVCFNCLSGRCVCVCVFKLYICGVSVLVCVGMTVSGVMSVVGYVHLSRRACLLLYVRPEMCR